MMESVLSYVGVWALCPDTCGLRKIQLADPGGGSASSFLDHFAILLADEHLVMHIVDWSVFTTFVRVLARKRAAW